MCDSAIFGSTDAAQMHVLAPYFQYPYSKPCRPRFTLRTTPDLPDRATTAAVAPSLPLSLAATTTRPQCGPSQC